jgi:hypothetical protein
MWMSEDGIYFKAICHHPSGKKNNNVLASNSIPCRKIAKCFANTDSFILHHEYDFCFKC